MLTFAPFFFTSNELIARDEALHTEFACELYSMLQRKLSDAEVHAIVGEAVEVEIDFVTNALPTALIGINSGLMSDYVRFCADRLLLALGAPKLYRAANPFEWMGARGRRVQPPHPHHCNLDNATLAVAELISLQGKTNFFVRQYEPQTHAPATLAVWSRCLPTLRPRDPAGEARLRVPEGGRDAKRRGEKQLVRRRNEHERVHAGSRFLKRVASRRVRGVCKLCDL